MFKEWIAQLKRVVSHNLSLTNRADDNQDEEYNSDDSDFSYDYVDIKPFDVCFFNPERAEQPKLVTDDPEPPDPEFIGPKIGPKPDALQPFEQPALPVPPPRSPQVKRKERKDNKGSGKYEVTEIQTRITPPKRIQHKEGNTLILKLTIFGFHFCSCVIFYYSSVCTFYKMDVIASHLLCCKATILTLHNHTNKETDFNAFNNIGKSIAMYF